MGYFSLVALVTRFSRTGDHKEMAGMLNTLFCHFYFFWIDYIIGHDINYLAISGILSVGSRHAYKFSLDSIDSDR